MQLTKPPHLASIMTLCGITVLCTLGTWQLQRLEWKKNILEKLDTEFAKPITDIPLLSTDEIITVPEYTRAKIQGHFNPSQSIKLGPRTKEGETGYNLYTAFTLKKDQTILVNRGWIPANWVDTQTPDADTQIIWGTITNPPKPNNFTPENKPEKQEWYDLNLTQIAQEKGIPKILPVILIEEGTTKNNQTIPPIRIETKPKFQNNHLQYAFFWFSMAAALLSIFTLRFIIKPK